MESYSIILIPHIMSSRLIHIAVYIQTAFILRLNYIPLHRYSTFCLSIHPQHMEYIYIFAIMNNVWVYRYLFKSLQKSLGFIPRCRITGSYHKSIFHFWRIFHPDFHSGCTIYIPTSTRITISLHNFQYLSFSVCFVPLGSSQPKGCELASEWGFEGEI